MAEAEKWRYRGKIGNHDVVITSNKDDAHMDAVFEIANQQLAQLHQANASLKFEDQLILLAVNAISDQLDMQTKLDEGKEA
ncbi:cell division protein ZapA [Weissella uvarum]|uniref:cell division protein ZapA n=1 Tax=Weissella uvarum TaxID=1479233 RepID=UPI00196137B7|nr:cell division protein ZapA [Weissella uvarum]MBM7618115.1 cell division protein ZapA [Weissella uvarum]MCM0595143.1 cell division protein ZapA [Weissella uvarum]